MNSKISNYKYPLRFYLLATFIPWIFWIFSGYISHLEPISNFYISLSSVLGFIGVMAPMLISFWIIFKDDRLKKDLLSRVFNFKDIKPIYIFLTLFLMLGSILLAQFISLAFGYSTSQFTITGHYTFSSGVFPVSFILIIVPILEELGWHTYGTDVLRTRFNLFKTSMIFALYWGVWHMPLSLINNYYQSNLVDEGAIHSINFLVSLFPFVIIMNWLYYKANRNIIIPIVFHITAVYFNEIFATHPDTKVIQTLLLLILSVFIILRDKEFFFSK